MAYETIIYKKESGVATITLNRPQALNAFVPQMNQEVMDALKVGERDQEVRCFMITGAGRAFCAGQDLKGRTPDHKGSLGASLREKYNPMIRQIRQMEKIVIAAVNGVAAGAGCNFALACDLRVASEDAKFILSICQDKDGLLWLGTGNGIKSFDPGTKKFTHYFYHTLQIHFYQLP